MELERWATEDNEREAGQNNICSGPRPLGIKDQCGGEECL